MTTADTLEPLPVKATRHAVSAWRARVDEEVPQTAIVSEIEAPEAIVDEPPEYVVLVHENTAYALYRGGTVCATLARSHSTALDREVFIVTTIVTSESGRHMARKRRRRVKSTVSIVGTRTRGRNYRALRDRLAASFADQEMTQ